MRPLRGWNDRTKRLQLGKHGAPGIPDVTIGDNTVTFTQEDQTFNVKGFPAKRGYDLSTGLGTVDAASLTRELAR